MPNKLLKEKQNKATRDTRQATWKPLVSWRASHVICLVDLHRIKQFIRSTGDKFVFVEDGEPSLVVMSFHDYDRLVAGRPGQYPRSRERDFDMVAASFETERMRQRQEELGAWGLNGLNREAAGVPEKRNDSIRLEDLPL